MDEERWRDVEHHLAAILVDEVRLVTDRQIAALRRIAHGPDSVHAAQELAPRLTALNLGGDLTRELARRMSEALGAPVVAEGDQDESKPSRIWTWMTEPTATTMERPESTPH